MTDFSKVTHETVPCKWCGEPTLMLGTKMCDRCWELEHRISADIALAMKIISALLEKK
jgi:NMD protein affecting ribosome stability and mRNA decay